MKKLVLALICCFALFPPGVHAEVSQLKVGISTGYPPFYFFTADNRPSGVCVDIIDQVALHLGVKVQYVSYPWKRMLEYGKSGEVDAVMPLFQTTEREQFLLFPAEALTIEENRFFTAASSDLGYSGKLDDVVNFSIGVIDGFSYGKEFDSLELKQKISVPSLDQLLQLVLYQRVDFGIGNPMVVTYAAQQMGKADQLRFLSPPVTADPLFIGFSKMTIEPGFVSRFSDALRKFKATDAYGEILSIYGL